MSAGLKALLEAAQYIEHQENLKRSPLAAATDAVELCYVGPCSTECDITGGVNNNNNIIARNVRHTSSSGQQVSSSAPAASATFQHVTNGVILTNISNSLTGSQLLIEAKASHRMQINNSIVNDYDFTSRNICGTILTLNGNARVTPSTKLLSPKTVSINGSTNENRMCEDAFSSNSNSSSKFNGFAELDSPRQQQRLVQQPVNEDPSLGNSKSKTFRLVDSGSGDIVVVTAAANKQMLLNDGLRVASPAATMGDVPSKAISIPKQSQQHSAAFSTFSLVNSTPAPHSVPRYKSSDPLTPPLVACRKVDETHTRIRSFSLSHKIPASQLHLHNGDVIAEDRRGMQCIGDDHSPPRQTTTGSHYLQMISAQHAGTGSQMMHVAPTIGSNGRRRTISSNSNGAGTREVHNKLEKNRRAHLKECYEQLKNQLPLKEDERKKTSNLAILGEAIKYVKTLKKKDQELEAEVEQLAKTKINSQLKLVSLKRELGPKYEQMFPGPFLDFDINSEKEHINETGSLSSGRGSILYSSSSSLSSGGSNGSTSMSSPVGGSIQVAQPTALSPVISKTYSSGSTANSVNGVNTSSNVSVTSKSTNALEHNQQHHHQQQTKSATLIPGNAGPAGVLTTNTNVALTGGSVVNVNMSSVPLSLTAKNISAMSLTRDSPTPSTPSPSPSSSSCISSSSSLISSSPPRGLNGVISGRSVTLSIPNSLKFTNNSGIGSAAGAGATIANGTSSTTATIIATSTPNNGVNTTNNAIMLQALRGCHLV